MNHDLSFFYNFKNFKDNFIIINKIQKIRFGSARLLTATKSVARMQ